MSTVFITEHNETIQGIDKEPCQIICTGPTQLYVSKYKPKVLRDERKPKECHKTFGYACVPLPNPCNFMKKHSRTPPPCTKRKRKCALPSPRPCLPACPVTKKEEKPDPTKAWDAQWKKGQGKRYPCPPKADICSEPKKQKAVSSSKNFRALNKLGVLRSSPRQPVPKFADTKKGDTHLLCPSGLVPCYIHKKNYGKVPGYLSSSPRPSLQPEPQATRPEYIDSTVPENERSQLLEGLRKNWTELQKIYLSLPILTDTLPKRLRKERLEKELQQLEHDIRILERHKHIYVVDENSI